MIVHPSNDKSRGKNKLQNKVIIMSHLESSRGRDILKTADGYIVKVGDQIWIQGNLSQSKTVQSITADFDDTGEIVLDNNATVYVALVFYEKINALQSFANIINKKLTKGLRETGFLASDLKLITDEIRAIADG